MRQNWQDDESRQTHHRHPVHPVKERLFRVFRVFRVFRGLSSYVFLFQSVDLSWRKIVRKSLYQG